MDTRTILNTTGTLISLGLIAVLAGVTWALIFREVPEANQNALLILIGILSTNITQVVNFFFGSTSDAKRQAETIDTLAKTTATAQMTPAPAGPAAMVIPPGESATATSTPSGTVITPESAS
jgi:hypothetical protein